MRTPVLILIAVMASAFLSSPLSAAAATPRSAPVAASHSSSPAPSPSPSPSPSSPLSALFPALSSAVRDLSVVDAVDAGYLTVAKRNVRFLLGAMVSPLQLLDWSHWSPELRSSADWQTWSSSDTPTDMPPSMERGQYQPGADAMTADVADDEVDFALHGDPSQMVRVTVNAHKQRTTPYSPHHYDSSSSTGLPAPDHTSTYAADSITGAYQPAQSRMHSMQRVDDSQYSTAAPVAATLTSDGPLYHPYHQAFDSSSFDPVDASSTAPPPIQPDSSSSAGSYVDLSSSSSSSSSSSAPLPDTCDDLVSSCGRGGRVNFTLWNSTLNRLCTRQLCVCPYDYTTTQCTFPYLFSCRPHLFSDPQRQCEAVRRIPPATAYASHSDDRPNTHIAASRSQFFTYEAILSGPTAPCLTLDERTTELSFNLTCRFWGDGYQETWGDWGYWNRTVHEGYVQNGTMPTFQYYVLNVEPQTNQVLFAMSLPYDPIRFAVRIHNTAHPSQYNSTTFALTAPNLQYTNRTTTSQVTPVTLPFHLPTLSANMKRGGRVLLTVGFAQQPWGLDSGSSGTPWQLTVEDATWVLPAAVRRVFLTRWQWFGVVVLVVVVVALCGWRWYQRRQTAKMQALLAEQRGKQQSWFEHAD